MFLLSVILIFIALFLLIYVLITPFGRYRRMGDEIPGPRTYPFLGDAYWLFMQKNFLVGITKLSEEFGKVSRLWLWTQLFTVITDPYDIKYFLTSSKHIAKSYSYKLLDAWIGNGLLASSGDMWRTHRKILIPAFHYKILEHSFEISVNHADELIRCLATHSNSNQPFEVIHYIEKCTLDNIYESALGNNIRTQTSLETTYLDILKSLTKCSVKRISSPWLHPEILFLLSPTGREYYRSLKVSRGIVNEIIEKRKNILSSNQKEPNINVETGKKKCNSFIDILLSENNFTDREIHDEIQTFMLAGQDTSKTAIIFCIYLLSKHRDVQTKVVEEITSIGENFTYQDLPKMKYLEKVIKESMRMYAPVPLIARHIDEDVTLPSGTTLPAGASITISLYSLHHNPDHFPNPEVFDPERFNEDIIREPFSHLPFSAGIRNCIGQRYAMMLVKTILSKLLMEYEIIDADVNKGPLTLDSRLTLHSEENIIVAIRKRNL